MRTCSFVNGFQEWVWNYESDDVNYFQMLSRFSPVSFESFQNMCFAPAWMLHVAFLCRDEKWREVWWHLILQIIYINMMLLHVFTEETKTKKNISEIQHKTKFYRLYNPDSSCVCVSIDMSENNLFYSG